MWFFVFDFFTWLTVPGSLKIFFCVFLCFFVDLLIFYLYLNINNAKTYIMKKELFIYFAIFTAANFVAFAVTLFAQTFSAFTGS